MVDRKVIDRAKMFGYGKEAKVLGQPYRVYRLTDFSNGDFLDEANLFLASRYVYTKVGAAKDFKDTLEASKWEGVLWYILKADFTRCKVGDVFVLNDSSYGAGKTSVTFPTFQQNMFVLTSLKPTKNSIGARLDTFVQIFRPVTQDFGAGVTNANPLRQIQGIWQFGDLGEIAHFVPAGLMASSHTTGQKAFTGVPGGMNPKPSWFGFLPSLQGFSFTEGDQLRTINGEVYSVQIAYEQHVGDVGSQLVLQRESGGDPDANPLDEFSQGKDCC